MQSIRKLPIQIGMNGRLFPNNWRPAAQEIAFAEAHGFQALQIRRDDAPIDEEQLGASFSDIFRIVQNANLVMTVELVMRVNDRGRLLAGLTPTELLEANLAAIQALHCHLVHWHIVPAAGYIEQSCVELEDTLLSHFSDGVALARKYGFELGFEHNEPDLLLFSTPESCHRLLDSVPNLKFVWDFNHTIPAHLPGFLKLVPYMAEVHVSDTPLPEVNHHLPLGLGTIDFGEYVRHLLDGGFCGPAILEIGGLPKSGGMGRDTDNALRDSHQYFKRVIEAQCCKR